MPNHCPKIIDIDSVNHLNLQIKTGTSSLQRIETEKNIKIRPLDHHNSDCKRFINKAANRKICEICGLYANIHFKEALLSAKIKNYLVVFFNGEIESKKIYEVPPVIIRRLINTIDWLGISEEKTFFHIIMPDALKILYVILKNKYNEELRMHFCKHYRVDEPICEISFAKVIDYHIKLSDSNPVTLDII